MSQNININETPGLFMPTVYCSQYDVGRTIKFKVTSSEGYNIPSGATVKMEGTKPSGLGFTLNGTVSDNEVTFVSTDSETECFTDEAGIFAAELSILSGTDVIGTANFYIEVEPSPHPTGTTDGKAETVIPIFTQLVERIEAAAAAVDEDVSEIDGYKTAAETAATNAAESAEEAARYLDIIERGSKIFGAKWDRTTNLLTRTRDAADITTDTTNFCHKGTFNDNINNPFDSIYPWSEMVVCNVDLVAYRNRTGEEPLQDFITAVYGDADFTYDGTTDLFVGAYRPEFWYRSEEDSNGNVEFLVSQSKRAGYKHAEEAIDGISFAVNAGSNALTCGTGVPYTNVTGSALHAYAENSGFTLQDIEAVDQQMILYLVEYANMNSQNALGDGCSSCYRENAVDVISNVSVGTDSTTFEVTDSALSSVVYKGAQADFGASAGGFTYRGIITDFSVSGSTYTITVEPALALTDGLVMSIHGFGACEFPAIGASVGHGSGYIGANGKANAWYRGRVMYANRYQYTLGIYRQANTNHLWICPDGVDPNDYDTLNTSVHLDTGVALPDIAAAWQTVGGNAQLIDKLSAFMATGISSGSSASPVGDQQYVPAITASNTVLWLGCHAPYGWVCGLFGCIWDSGAGDSYWYSAARPLLKKSL